MNKLFFLIVFFIISQYYIYSEPQIDNNQNNKLSIDIESINTKDYPINVNLPQNDTLPIISFIFSIFAVGISFFLGYFSNKTSKKNHIFSVLNALLEEYRSESMGKSLQNLFGTVNSYKKDGNLNQEEFFKYYKTIYRIFDKKEPNMYRETDNRGVQEKSLKVKFKEDDSDIKIKVEDKNLHWDRRKISHFFQQIAVLIDKNIIAKDFINTIWRKEHLKSMIGDVIIPIETILLPSIFNQDPLDEKTWPMKKLLENIYK